MSKSWKESVGSTVAPLLVILVLFIVLIIMIGAHMGTKQDDGARLNATVNKILLPLMKEIKDDINSVKNDLSSLNKAVSSLNRTVENPRQQTACQSPSPNNTHTQQLEQLYNTMDKLDLKLDAVNVSMREELRAMESQLEEHQTQTTTQLAGQHTSLQSNIHQLSQQLGSVNYSVRGELSTIESQLAEHQTETTRELAEQHTSLLSNIHQLSQQLGSVNYSVRGELSTIESQLVEHQTETTRELAEQHTSLLSNIHQLSTFVDTLDSKLDSVNSSISGELRAMESQLAEHQIQTTTELAGQHTSLLSNIHQLSTFVDTLDSKLDSVNSSISGELRALESQLENHDTQTILETADLQSNVISELAALHTSLQSNTQQLAQLSTDMDTLDSKLDSINASIREELRVVESRLEMNESQIEITLAGLHSLLESNTHTELIEISTKMDTLDLKLDSVNNSGVLIREDLSCIKTNLSSLDKTMSRIDEGLEEHGNHTSTELMNFFKCGGIGWRRVVYLDMADPNTNCPSGWQLTSHSKRTCDKASSGDHTCDSATFPVSGGGYTRVCGKIIAYQYGWTDGFESYHMGDATTIDDSYVNGISLTHGSPRQHIWTFAAGASEGGYTWDDACPCDATINITVPPFVGGDYFCESGVNTVSIGEFHPDDPLWDGMGCTATSTCCSLHNPPYFIKQLSSPTSDDLEARMCERDGHTTPVQFIELYVQ